MDAGRIRHQREIGSVVDDHRRVVGSRCSDDAVAEIEKGAGRELLGANLETSGSAIQKGTSQVRRAPPGAMCDVDVNDGVERREGDQAVSARLVFFGCGMNRSMKAVLKRPAWKSGSFRIFKCNGTDVRMPSMTVMSSVRLIRAIAS